MKSSSISVCMIVKNEEKVLERALRGVSLFADEIIIVDTGSTDRTMEVAARFTDRIYEHPWEDHFGKMRNISYSYAACDYVMYFDADYEIDAENADKINQLKKTLTNEKSICVTYYSPEQKLPVALHCISFRDERQWEGAVHERLPLKEPVLYTDITIRHVKKEEFHYDRNVKLFSKLTKEELKKNYWLVAQCYSDSVMADASEWTDFFFQLSQSEEYDFPDKLSPAVTAGHVLMYYGKYREDLKWLEQYLRESGRWLEKYSACEHMEELRKSVLFYDAKANNYAIKCAVECKDWNRAGAWNQRMKTYHGESLLYSMNQLWVEREMRKETNFVPVTISVCMIVRDEETVLERCLKNAIQFADELIIADTGSVDRTKEIAAGYTDMVYNYVWNDDFAAARNFSYEKASCDYVMWLDADDDIEQEDIERILFLKNHMPPNTDVVYFRYTGDATDDDIFGDNELIRDRLIRRSLHPVWVYPIHEAIQIQREWKELYRPDIRIYHRKEKVNEERRNIRIFERKMAEDFRLDSFNRSYYCRELSTDGSHEQAVEEFEILLREGIRADIDYAMFFYIRSMKELKRYGALRKSLEEYVKKYGDNEMVFCTLGDLCRREKEDKKAINWYQMALDMPVDIRDKKLHFPAYHEFLPWLGICKAYIRLGKLREAEQALKKAEVIHPRYMELQLIKLFFERKENCMKELMKKLMEAGKKDAFCSLDELIEAAKELGYTKEQIDEALDGFDGFPLDDDDLDEITGGLSFHSKPCVHMKNCTY